MRAVGFKEFGGPEVLEILELPQPVPDADEVVVRVVAAPVNPTDLLMRAGKQAALMTGLVPPYVGGMEFCGDVCVVGSAVQGIDIGQFVMGVLNPRRPEGGAHAEYVRVPAASIAALDESVDLVSASTVPMNGLTAIAALEQLALPPGGTLMVTGGAGVLAGYVIQLAKLEGLRVIADAKEDACERLLGLGVDHIVPRGDGMAQAVLAICPQGVDGLVDTALIGQSVASLVRDGGSTVAVRRTHVIVDERLRCGYVGVTEHMQNTAALQRLANLLCTGDLRPQQGRWISPLEMKQVCQQMECGLLRLRPILGFDGC